MLKLHLSIITLYLKIQFVCFLLSQETVEGFEMYLKAGFDLATTLYIRFNKQRQDLIFSFCVTVLDFLTFVRIWEIPFTFLLYKLHTYVRFLVVVVRVVVVPAATVLPVVGKVRAQLLLFDSSGDGWCLVKCLQTKLYAKPKLAKL